MLVSITEKPSSIMTLIFIVKGTKMDVLGDVVYFNGTVLLLSSSKELHSRKMWHCEFACYYVLNVETSTTDMLVLVH